MDLGNNIKQVTTLVPVALAATTEGVTVDTQGYESLAFLISVGEFTFTAANALTWKVQKGDTTTPATDLAASEYTVSRREDGAAWGRVQNDVAADKNQTFTLGIRKDSSKRYYRIHVTEAGTVSVLAAAVALLGNPRHAPATVAQVP